MGKEIGALEDNQTWRLVDLWLGKKAIGSKWVYIIKYKLDGAIEREGIDYNETFVHVAKMDTVCTLLAITILPLGLLLLWPTRNAIAGWLVD